MAEISEQPDGVFLDLACALNIGKERGQEMDAAAARHLESALRRIVREEVLNSFKDLLQGGGNYEVVVDQDPLTRKISIRLQPRPSVGFPTTR